jgi:hypothetical protein
MEATGIRLRANSLKLSRPEFGQTTWYWISFVLNFRRKVSHGHVNLIVFLLWRDGPLKKPLQGPAQYLMNDTSHGNNVQLIMFLLKKIFDLQMKPENWQSVFKPFLNIAM